MKKHIIGENGIGYTLNENEIYYLELELTEKTDYQIGKYGHMRQKYLREYHKAVYSRMLLTGEMNEHLRQVDKECNQRIEMIISQMKERQGVIEQLKGKDQIERVQWMKG